MQQKNHDKLSLCNIESWIATNEYIDLSEIVQRVLLSSRETGWLGGEAGVLTGGARVEPLPEGNNMVTREDIVDKLLFVVHILKERDDVHALKNWKKKDTRQNIL